MDLSSRYALYTPDINAHIARVPTGFIVSLLSSLSSKSKRFYVLILPYGQLTACTADQLRAYKKRYTVLHLIKVNRPMTITRRDYVYCWAIKTFQL